MAVPRFKSLLHFTRYMRRLPLFVPGAERDDADGRRLRHAVFAVKSKKICCFDLQKQQDADVRAPREAVAAEGGQGRQGAGQEDEAAPGQQDEP